MEHKKRLAWDITSQFHDAAAADAAQAHFERVVQGRSLPDEMPEVSLSSGVSVSGELQTEVHRRVDNLLVQVGLATSNAEARRLITQGAVELIRQSGETERLSDPRATVTPVVGDVIRAGRRRFVRIIA